MSSESTKSEEPVLTPELAYLKMISASAFHVANRLKDHKVKPDTILKVSAGEMLLPKTPFFAYSNTTKESWKITETIRSSLASETGVKVGFVLTELGQLLDYVDYGKGPVHNAEYSLLPIIKDGELAEGNIMKNDIIVALGELCVRYDVNSKFPNIK